MAALGATELEEHMANPNHQQVFKHQHLNQEGAIGYEQAGWK